MTSVMHLGPLLLLHLLLFLLLLVVMTGVMNLVLAPLAVQLDEARETVVPVPRCMRLPPLLRRSRTLSLAVVSLDGGLAREPVLHAAELRLGKPARDRRRDVPVEPREHRRHAEVAHQLHGVALKIPLALQPLLRSTPGPRPLRGAVPRPRLVRGIPEPLLHLRLLQPEVLGREHAHPHLLHPVERHRSVHAVERHPLDLLFPSLVVPERGAVTERLGIHVHRALEREVNNHPSVVHRRERPARDRVKLVASSRLPTQMRAAESPEVVVQARRLLNTGRSRNRNRPRLIPVLDGETPRAFGAPAVAVSPSKFDQVRPGMVGQEPLHESRHRVDRVLLRRADRQ